MIFFLCTLICGIAFLTGHVLGQRAMLRRCQEIVSKWQD